jgi:predicted small metal-binding protein
MFKYINRGSHYEVVDATGEVVETVVDHYAAYQRVHELNIAIWKQSERHTTRTRTRTLGGSPIRGGGTFRCSEAHCSCGWSSTDNGQTYSESMQAIREHLKEMDVYTTSLEQSVYAYIKPDGSTSAQIAEKAGKTVGRVEKALVKMVERGNVEKREDATYVRTDKWFSWND